MLPFEGRGVLFIICRYVYVCVGGYGGVGVDAGFCKLYLRGRLAAEMNAGLLRILPAHDEGDI